MADIAFDFDVDALIEEDQADMAREPAREPAASAGGRFTLVFLLALVVICRS